MKREWFVSALAALVILNAGDVRADGEDYIEQCKKEDFSATWNAVGLRVDKEGKSHTFRCYLNVRDNGKIPKGGLSNCFDQKDESFDLCKKNYAKIDKHCNVELKLRLRINGRCSRKFILEGAADRSLENLVAEGATPKYRQSMILQAIRHSEAD